MKLTEACNLAAEHHLSDKWDDLVHRLSTFNSAIVAFSGGVDSSFLAYCAHLVYGTRMLAVTVISEFETDEMVDFTRSFIQTHGIRYKPVYQNNLENPAIRTNPPERCYHCKLSILGGLWKMAHDEGYDVVFDGQNADDLNDFRPGMKAVQETGTISPLLVAGLTKAEIRILSHAFGLETWDHPSSPCLASRIPYGTEINLAVIKQIAAGERFLHEKGFSVVRVRVHGDLARIEIDPDQHAQFIRHNIETERFFHELGFKYVTLDIHGYRQGSLNEGIKA